MWMTDSSAAAGRRRSTHQRSTSAAHPASRSWCRQTKQTPCPANCCRTYDCPVARRLPRRWPARSSHMPRAPSAAFERAGRGSIGPRGQLRAARLCGPAASSTFAGSLLQCSKDAYICSWLVFALMALGCLCFCRVSSPSYEVRYSLALGPTHGARDRAVVGHGRELLADWPQRRTKARSDKPRRSSENGVESKKRRGLAAY